MNVAITRARRELLVFSSLTPDRINLSQTRDGGVADLKAFLSYAQHGMRSLPAAVAVPEADDFESPLDPEPDESDFESDFESEDFDSDDFDSLLDSEDPDDDPDFFEDDRLSVL